MDSLIREDRAGMALVTLLLAAIGFVAFVFVLWVLIVVLDAARQASEYFTRENARARREAARYRDQQA